jgi:hypothetical protein
MALAETALLSGTERPGEALALLHRDHPLKALSSPARRGRERPSRCFTATTR